MIFDMTGTKMNENCTQNPSQPNDHHPFPARDSLETASSRHCEANPDQKGDSTRSHEGKGSRPQLVGRIVVGEDAAGSHGHAFERQQKSQDPG